MSKSEAARMLNCWPPCEATAALLVARLFLPDGQRIVTASSDQTARVFRVVTLSEIAELPVK